MARTEMHAQSIPTMVAEVKRKFTMDRITYIDYIVIRYAENAVENSFRIRYTAFPGRRLATQGSMSSIARTWRRQDGISRTGWDR
jgi:hypothetical protein